MISKIEGGFSVAPKNYRTDRGEFRVPTKNSQGFLIADGFATRAGVFEYLFNDGTIFRELRPVEEVFKAESLKTLANVALTNDHPPEMINSTNAKRYAIGHCGERVDVDGIYVKVPVVIMDSQAIADVETRKKYELSCGYTCDLEMTQGAFEGVQYDAIQRNIVYNHLALVAEGRAGPEARMRVDSKGDEIKEGHMVKALAAPQVKNDSKKGESSMSVKMKLGHAEYEVQDAALAQAISVNLDELAKSKEKADSLQKQLDQLKGKADASELQLAEKVKEIDSLKKATHDKKDCIEIAKGRLALEQKASAVIGKEFKADGLTDLEIKKQIIQKANKEINLDGKNEEYLDGFIANLKSDAQEKSDEAGKVLGAALVGNNDGKDKEDGFKPGSYEEARQKHLDDSRVAWKKPAQKAS